MTKTSLPLKIPPPRDPRAAAARDWSSVRLDIPASGYDACIFDCDGTLADSMPLHLDAWLWALEKNAAPFTFALTDHYAYAGISIQAIVQDLNERYGTDLDPATVDRDRNAFVLERHRHIPPVPPVVDFARSQAGRRPMAVASGNGADIVEKTLSSLGIRGLFTAVITPENVGAGRGKPAPDMFLLAAEKLAVPPGRCLVFEDGQSGIQAAEAAGMQTVFIPAFPGG